MKKWIFTFFIAVISLGIINAQIQYQDEVIIADFEGDIEGYTLGGWGHDTLEVVDNPLSDDLNDSESVLKQVRNSGNWNSAVDIMFDEPVSLDGKNTIRALVYAAEDVYVFFRALHSGDSILAETWGGSPSPGGEWSHIEINVDGIASFSGVRIEFSTEWGDTPLGADTIAYIDDISISNAIIPMHEPDRIYSAKKTTEVLDIDGFDIEENWLDVSSTSIENVNFVVEGNTSIPANGSNFRALWDDDFLYLFVEIMDNSPTAPTSEEWWNHDGVELYFDGQGRNAEGGRLNGQYQIRINYDTETLSGDDDATWGLFMDNDMVWGQGSMAGGYTLEIAVPWMAIHGEDVDRVAAVGVGDMVTFDLSIQDEDPAIQDNRYTNVIWAGVDGSNHPYNSSQYWGAIKLDFPVSVGSQAAVKQALKVYPTPAGDYVRAEMSKLKSYELISITGASFVRGIATSDKVEINTRDLAPGLYFLRATNDNGNVEVQKVIKK